MDEKEKDELINTCKKLLREAMVVGNSQTDNKREYIGMFSVYGNTLEKISDLISY